MKKIGNAFDKMSGFTDKNKDSDFLGAEWVLFSPGLESFTFKDSSIINELGNLDSNVQIACVRNIREFWFDLSSFEKHQYEIGKLVVQNGSYDIILLDKLKQKSSDIMREVLASKDQASKEEKLKGNQFMKFETLNSNF